MSKPKKPIPLYEDIRALVLPARQPSPVASTCSRCIPTTRLDAASLSRSNPVQIELNMVRNS